MRDRPRFSYRMMQKLDRLGERTFLALSGENFQIHLGARQILTQTVVEFSRKFPALRVLQLQQAGSEATQRFLALPDDVLRLFPCRKFHRQQAIVYGEQLKSQDKRDRESNDSHNEEAMRRLFP